MDPLYWYRPGSGDLDIEPDLIKPWRPSKPGARPAFLSLGAGVESTAILLRYLVDPASRVINGRRFELEDLVCAMAMTGNEKLMTKVLTERYVLPLLRKNNVRLIQVARRGHEKRNGIVVLDDSTQPRELFIDGAYTLEEDMRKGGTVPQGSFNARTCSQNFKGFVLEAVIAKVIQGQDYDHIIGYSAHEGRRVDKDASYSKAGRNSYVPLYSEWGQYLREPERTDEDKRKRRPKPSLDEYSWASGMSREAAQGYIFAILGPMPTFNGMWPKSACKFCQFALHAQSEDSEEIVYHWLDNPDDLFDTLDMEFESLCFNSRQGLLTKSTLTDHLRKLPELWSRVEPLITAWQQRRPTLVHGIYKLERIDGSQTIRSIRQVLDSNSKPVLGTFDDLSKTLGQISRDIGQPVTHDFTNRIVIRDRDDKSHRLHEEYVITLAGADSKERRQFREEWQRQTGSGATLFGEADLSSSFTLAEPRLVR